MKQKHIADIGQPLTRRQFLVVSGAAGAAVYASGMVGRAASAAADQPPLQLFLFRREDMVWLQYTFTNFILQPQKSGAPRLVVETPGQTAFIVVQFPNQHVGEQCIDLALPSGPGAGQVITAVSGPSQIGFVFEGANGNLSIPATDEGLLSWQDWPINVLGASSGPVPSITDMPPMGANATQTDLQIVDHLHLTPDTSTDAIWQSASDPVTNAGRTELWGTRLVPAAGLPTGSPQSQAAQIRALTYENDTAGNFGVSGVTGIHEVFKTFDPHDIYVATGFAPGTVAGGHPADADLLMLTALGSWLELEGKWGPDLVKVPLAEWRHRSTQGRDNFVKIVDRGVLFPFGHHAELITISERQVHGDGVAYLYQRSFVRVKEPTRGYPAPGQVPSTEQLVAFPFTQVTLKTLVTPDILIPTVAATPGFPPPQSTTTQPDLFPATPSTTHPFQRAAFWIQIDQAGSNGGDVPFHIVATDLGGNTVDFTTSLAFVYLDTGDAYDPMATGPAIDYYNNQGPTPLAPSDRRRLINFNGQKVTFATERKPGDSTHPTSQFVLGATYPDTSIDYATKGEPAFGPMMSAAQVRIPAVEALQQGKPPAPNGASGSAPGATQQPLISYPYSYVLHGTGPQNPSSLSVTDALTENAGGLFALVTDPASASSFDAALQSAADSATSSQQYITTFEMHIQDAINSAEGATLNGVPYNQLSPGGQLALIQMQPAYTSAVGANAPLQSSSAGVAGNLTGGVALPNLSVGGLSQALGPISGGSLGAISNAAQGFVNPSSFFSADGPLAAKILGAVPLASILPTSVPFLSSSSSDSPSAPKIQTTVEYGNGMDKPPTGTLTVLDWVPEPIPFAPLYFVSSDNPWTGDGPLNGSGATSAFTIHATFETLFNSSQPTYEIKGTLTNFVLDLLEQDNSYIVVTFNRFAFSAKSGAKPKFDVDIADVSFDGPLKFIEALEQFLSSLGDGLAIDVAPLSISASLSLPIPSITLGIIAIQNMSFGAKLFLPFTGDPFTFTVNFCTRDNPFLVTIMCLGGGGFVSVTIGADGLQVVEASFEVGASAAINLGIASGSVSMAIGIYFKLAKQMNAAGTGTVDEITLTGYFQANGSVMVLGLVGISMEIYLGLTYMTPPPVVQGEATITLTIELGPFHPSFSASVQKQFAGGDPPAGLTFGQQMTSSDWNTYCDAFAD